MNTIAFDRPTVSGAITTFQRLKADIESSARTLDPFHHRVEGQLIQARNLLSGRSPMEGWQIWDHVGLESAAGTCGNQKLVLERIRSSAQTTYQALQDAHPGDLRPVIERNVSPLVTILSHAVNEAGEVVKWLRRDNVTLLVQNPGIINNHTAELRSAAIDAVTAIGHVLDFLHALERGEVSVIASILTGGKSDYLGQPLPTRPDDASYDPASTDEWNYIREHYKVEANHDNGLSATVEGDLWHQEGTIDGQIPIFSVPWKVKAKVAIGQVESGADLNVGGKSGLYGSGAAAATSERGTIGTNQLGFTEEIDSKALAGDFTVGPYGGDGGALDLGSGTVLLGVNVLGQNFAGGAELGLKWELGFDTSGGHIEAKLPFVSLEFADTPAE